MAATKYKALYQVLCFRHLWNLELSVNLAMAEGWTPLGGIHSHATLPEIESIFHIDESGEVAIGDTKPSDRLWAQALIKKRPIRRTK